MRIRMTVAVLAASALLWSSPAMAQRAGPAGGRHVVEVTAMRQAIADQAVADQQTRDVVIGVLQRSQVRDVANRLGLDVTRAEAAVATLDSADLARLAGPARAADAQLSGGSSTIAISMTTLLLIIIIVILLAR